MLFSSQGGLSIHPDAVQELSVPAMLPQLLMIPSPLQPLSDDLSHAILPYIYSWLNSY
jgi:hypothetical protein